MRKATLHISNNQASVSITMPSSPQHKLNRRKDSTEQQQSSNQALTSSNQNLHTKNIGSTDSKQLQQITSPRSPSPLFDKIFYDNELLNTSNTTSFRYPSQSFVMSQAALSSTLSTTMSNAHFNSQQQQQQQQQQQSFNQTAQQLKTQQDIEEQFFATIESSALAHNAHSAYQTQRQKSTGRNRY